MWQLTPSAERPAKRARAFVNRGRLGHGDAELVLGEAGRDVRVGGGVHVGVDADREARLHAAPRGQGVDERQLGFRFAIEAVNAARERVFHLGGRLAYAGEDHPAGSPPACSTRYNSPPETMSKPAPARASSPSTASDELAFTA